MPIRALRPDEKPSILFRVESSSNRMFKGGHFRARRTDINAAPELWEVDDHLLWDKGRGSRFLSFTRSWIRAMERHRLLENREREIIVIAIWSRDLFGVYDAESVATELGYFDTGSDRRRMVRNHRDEYLVDGGIAADEYCVLAVFEGSGPDRNVVFECPGMYRISTTIRGGFFSGNKSDNTLRDLEEEIYSHSGVRNDLKRDELVKSISGGFYNFPSIMYK